MKGDIVMTQRLFLLLVCFCMIVGVFLFTSCDIGSKYTKELIFELKEDGYHVVGLGESESVDIIIPEKYKGEPVVAIDQGAFSESKVNSIFIPNTVKNIGKRAFSGCEMTKLTIESDKLWVDYDAFFGCVELDKVNFNGNIAEWCKFSFENEGASPLRFGAELYINDVLLEDIVIPKDVSYIGQYAFAHTPSIKSVRFEEDSKCYGMGSRAFEGCTSLQLIEMPQRMKIIGRMSFSGCSALESISFDLVSSVLRFEEYAFVGCNNLHDVYITGDCEKWLDIEKKFEYSSPLSNGADLYFDGQLVEHLTISSESLPKGALSGCTSIKTIEFAEGVRTIGSLAFSNCVNLEKVTISSTVKNIENRAFDWCDSLSEVHFNGTLKDWMLISFEDVSANPLFNHSDLYIGNELLKNLVIPEGITDIYMNTFAGCTSIETVNVPGHVFSIKYYAFFECPNITTVVIDEGVRYIRTQAFFGCESVEYVRLPSSLESFGYESDIFNGSMKFITFEYNDTVEKWESIARHRPLGYLVNGYIIICTNGSITE